ncbi:hypothetical protein PFISCL1PPCAC_5365, partial [Pristionchus fissidentatus]
DSPSCRTPSTKTPGARTPTVETGPAAPSPNTPKIVGTPVPLSAETPESLRYQDEHGNPVREQERVSYQNMLVRYGDWSRIRGQVMVYTALLAIGLVYERHSSAVEFLQGLETVKGRHIQCCCDVPKRLKDIENIGEAFEAGGSYPIIDFILLLIFGLTCMLWERFVGRRKMLKIIMILGMLASVILMFPHHVVHHVGHILLKFCMIATKLISIVNFIEMLPYETRYLSFSMLNFVSGFCGAFAIIRDEEQVLYDENPGEGRHYHEAVSRKIFEDLV